jgi:SAM-dependent methyltransferase
MMGFSNTNNTSARIQQLPVAAAVEACIPRKVCKTDSTASIRELGLELASIAARHLFQTDHLHYGYWPDGMAAELRNLPQAQENYTDLIIGHIPPGVRTILDVGAGTGVMAKRLRELGYSVDCVSPSPYLAEQARNQFSDAAFDNTPSLGNPTDVPTSDSFDTPSTNHVFESRYEDLQTNNQYDLILFSESFQYIEIGAALSRSCDLLRCGGYLLICDFFRNPTPDRGPFGGGHPIAEFHRRLAALPLQSLTDEDITDRMTPNIDLVADFVDEVVGPARERIIHYLEKHYPLPLRFLCWMFRRPLKRMEEKYLTGKRRGASFKVYKTYRLLLLQRQPRPCHEQFAAGSQA